MEVARGHWNNILLIESLVMSLKVELPLRLTGQIARLGLPDSVLVDVHRRLREEFALNPLPYLRRLSDPFDGLVY